MCPAGGESVRIDNWKKIWLLYIERGKYGYRIYINQKIKNKINSLEIVFKLQIYPNYANFKKPIDLNEGKNMTVNK